MKMKLLAAALALLSVLSLSACSLFHTHVEEPIPAVYATSFSTGVTEGVRCRDCGEILQEGEETPIVEPVDIRFSSGSVTQEPTVITTEHFRFEIPANVYIPDGFEEKVEQIASLVEHFSGLTLNSNPNYDEGLILVEVIKPTNTEAELQEHASASPGIIYLQSGDLLDLGTLAHEMSHYLQYNQSPWFYCTWAMESISTYTTYKIQKYIQENDSELLSFVGTTNKSLSDLKITNFDALYENSMEYWIDHVFEYSGNTDYSIGFTLAWYLDETFGDYTKWILEYEKANPYYDSGADDMMLSGEEQLRAFTMTYGEDVFDNFYAWLKQNQSILTCEPVDLRNAEYIQLYPTFASYGIYYALDNGTEETVLLYKDLYIDFSAGKQYLTEYKGRNIDGISLFFVYYNDVLIECYDSDGNLVRVAEAIYDENYNLCVFESIEDISFVKLVGEGTINCIAAKGFDMEYHE